MLKEAIFLVMFLCGEVILLCKDERFSWTGKYKFLFHTNCTN